MKFTSTIALTSLMTFFSTCLADSESFGLISLRSTTPVHLSSVGPSDGVVVVGYQGNSISAVVTDEGYLKFSDGSYVVVTSDGQYTVTTDSSKATSGWSLNDGYLKINNAQSYVAVPVSNTYELYNKGSASGDISISIGAFTSGGSRAADFTPSGSNTDSNNSNTNSTTTTVAPTYSNGTTTVSSYSTTLISSEYCGGKVCNGTNGGNSTTFTSQSENIGFKMNGGNAGAVGLFAAIGALLL
ncbi:hypothetical protein ACO0QE_002016 [Hanseniaspora vineae]